MSASDSPALLPPGFAEDEPPFDLDAVHRTHGNWLLAFLRRRFSPQDAEDLAQETYVRAAASQSPIRNPRAFLARVATNAARDQFRRQAARPMLVGEGEATAQAATPAEALEDLLQKQIILSLPPQLRDVYLLRSYTPLTNAEIAERCGISVKTVEERVTKALAICKVLLRD
ncbi:MAG TPA: RNA polymerase sigma factor [Caulobacteraceae bacterium]|jgi:RNA polymerase sigma-70 factor (ECF subfamily)